MFFLSFFCPILFGLRPLPAHQYFQPTNSKDWTTEKQFSFFQFCYQSNICFTVQSYIICCSYIFITLSIHKKQQLKDCHNKRQPLKRKITITAPATTNIHYNFHLCANLQEGQTKKESLNIQRPLPCCRLDLVAALPVC